jgi:hypothetical protein
MEAGHPGLLKLVHEPLEVEWPSVTSICIADHGQVDTGGDTPEMISHEGQVDEAEVWPAQEAGRDRIPRDVCVLKPRVLNQPEAKPIVDPRGRKRVCARERAAKRATLLGRAPH